MCAICAQCCQRRALPAQFGALGTIALTFLAILRIRHVLKQVPVGRIGRFFEAGWRENLLSFSSLNKRTKPDAQSFLVTNVLLLFGHFVLTKGQKCLLK